MNSDLEERAVAHTEYLDSVTSKARDLLGQRRRSEAIDPVVVFFVIVAGGIRLVMREKALPSRRRHAGLAAMLLTAGLHFALLDGWPWAVLPYLGGDDTEFAPTYSALGFWSIRAGLTRDQVVARAGEPLERYPMTDRPNEEGWRWTRSPHSGDYRVRVVVFRDGRVVSKVSEYYLD